jgi:hypothetical protein
MKKFLMCLVGLCMVGIIQASPAFVIDDFENWNSADYTSTVILDNNGGSSNTAVWQATGGVLQLNTTIYDGIQQYAMIYNGLILPVGGEIQTDVVHSASSQDIGLYVGGTTPTANVRRDYIAMYARNSGELFTRGFDGTTEYGQVGWISPPYNMLFIARVGANTFEVGYYEDGVRNIMVTRTPVTANEADVVGFYADVRAVGTLGDPNNLKMLTRAHTPSVAQAMGGLTYAAATLSWQAAPPQDPESTDAVNPDILDQYVFIHTGSETDPNYYYVGATGDPGTTVPASSLLVEGRVPYDSSISWVVVEMLQEPQESFVIGSSTLDDVDDANNIVGLTWTFDSLNSAPTITADLDDIRVFATEPDVVFTCEFGSTTDATVAWYEYVDGANDTILSTGGDITIGLTNDGGGNYTATLQINTPSIDEEGFYYCIITNEVASATSAYGILAIKQLLVQYNFDGNLNPAVGSAADAPAGQGKSIAGLAEPNSLQASNVALAFETGVNGVGQAVVLDDPNQYVDFSTAAYPKAGSLVNGIGRGLDEGSILCWVKPTTSTTILANYNTGATTGFALSLAANSGTADGRIDVRGEGAAGEYEVIGTVQGRPGRPAWDVFDEAWHLIATTWTAGGTLRIYVDGQLVSSAVAGSPTQYLAWQRGVLLGAGRNSTNRDMLTNLYGGAIDNLRVYNYEIDAQAIAQEYLDATGIQPCMDSAFEGNYYNTDNTGASYCRVDLADFVDFAEMWLKSGLFE